MSSDLFYATICLLIGITTFFFWWHEMFSDGPVGEFSRSFDSDRGKNLIALTIPAIGTSLISGSALAFFLEITSPSAFQSRHPNILYSVLSSLLGTVGILSLLVFIVSFIPFTLPEWMYPEYHAAKREEQRRREAAERGEIEDRNPLLDDNGVYASQLGSIPTDIPEASGLPSTADLYSLQAVPSAEGPPPPHDAPEAGAPALHGPDIATSDSLNAVPVADGSGGQLGGAYSSLIDLLQAAVGEVAKATAQTAENASHAADLHDTVEEQISDSLSAILPQLD